MNQVFSKYGSAKVKTRPPPLTVCFKQERPSSIDTGIG